MSSNNKPVNDWNKVLSGIVVELLGTTAFILLGLLIVVAATGGRM